MLSICTPIFPVFLRTQRYSNPGMPESRHKRLRTLSKKKKTSINVRIQMLDFRPKLQRIYKTANDQ